MFDHVNKARHTNGTASLLRGGLNKKHSGAELCINSTKLSYSERHELFKLKLSSLLDFFV